VYLYVALALWIPQKQNLQNLFRQRRLKLSTRKRRWWHLGMSEGRVKDKRDKDHAETRERPFLWFIIYTSYVDQVLTFAPPLESCDLLTFQIFMVQTTRLYNLICRTCVKSSVVWGPGPVVRRCSPQPLPQSVSRDTGSRDADLGSSNPTSIHQHTSEYNEYSLILNIHRWYGRSLEQPWLTLVP
jgi:hypothetical protein